MNPCGYLPSYQTTALMAEGLPGAVSSWWVLYGPALVAVLLVVGVVIAYDAWAQLTGHMTLSNMLRRGPGWLRALVGSSLIWLWVHLLVQGRMSSFRQALEASLRCPKCPAMNRPGATVIELSDDRKTACCSVCAKAGPVDQFLQKETDRNG